MTKYTKDVPFAWKNNRYFRDADGTVMAVFGDGDLVEPASVPSGIAAFEAAEREEIAKAARYDDVEDLIAARFPREAEEADQRITAWYKVVHHPVLKPCYEYRMALLPAILKRLDALAELEVAVNELAPAPIAGEAELNDKWHWTNDDHTEARKGRWTMRDDGPWVLHHDDFIMPMEVSIAPYWVDGQNGDARINEIVWEIFKGFNVWRDAQQPTTPPIPEVGQWIKATLRNGEVDTFQVTGVRDKGRYYSIDSDADVLFINKPNAVSEQDDDILAWEPAELPQPEEPIGFGYVGFVTKRDGEVLDVLRGDGNRRDIHHVISRADGCHYGHHDWPGVLKLGTFTAVTP